MGHHATLEPSGHQATLVKATTARIQFQGRPITMQPPPGPVTGTVAVLVVIIRKYKQCKVPLKNKKNMSILYAYLKVSQIGYLA